MLTPANLALLSILLAIIPFATGFLAKTILTVLRQPVADEAASKRRMFGFNLEKPLKKLITFSWTIGFFGMEFGLLGLFFSGIWALIRLGINIF